ncbi:ParB N-terminal domain-containing protein [Erysipelothrix amsterdamensis]|uniref:ParB N-terminal domain-containing protein n=1 Tax=Erysipelothrix amsterdamensis TaxID=2929157 RepID=A0AAU9VIG2_9FIRM|nr:ParB N-terminal domain-containing protein [Erysipelothrix sp. A18Y020d]CAH2762053.1 ParB N-terminal domain-containing protein [Erysipelothrix sp. A18Y020d]
MSLFDIKNGTDMSNATYAAVAKPKLILIDDLLDHVDNREYQKERIDALVYNIKQDGLLQPIVITPSNELEGKYTILAGHHRVQAYKRLREIDDQDMYEAILSIVLPSMDETDKLKYVLTTNVNPELSFKEKEALLKTADHLYQKLIAIGKKPMGRKRDWLVNVTGLSQYFVRKFEGDPEKKKESPTLDDQAKKLIKQFEKQYAFLADYYAELDFETQQKIASWILDLESITR